LYAIGGANDFGQLGLSNRISRSEPIQIGSLTNWSTSNGKLSTGNQWVLAIKQDGTLWAWGQNTFAGVLGLNDRINRSSPTQIGSGTTWLNCSAGWYHAVATKTDGTLWAWGRNWEGQLGTNNSVYRSSPIQIGTDTNWILPVTAMLQTIATKTNGTLWAWGSNGSGHLGLNNLVYRSSPTQVGSATNWTNDPKLIAMSFSGSWIALNTTEV
jgi:alpha-tubulin suppressor-like RCC1 family protein